MNQIEQKVIEKENQKISYKFYDNIFKYSETTDKDGLYNEWIRLGPASKTTRDFPMVCICNQTITTYEYYYNPKTAKLITIGGGCRYHLRKKKYSAKHCQEVIENHVGKGKFDVFVMFVNYNPTVVVAFLKNIKDYLMKKDSDTIIEQNYLDKLEELCVYIRNSKQEKKTHNIFMDLIQNIIVALKCKKRIRELSTTIEETVNHDNYKDLKNKNVTRWACFFDLLGFKWKYNSMTNKFKVITSDGHRKYTKYFGFASSSSIKDSLDDNYRCLGSNIVEYKGSIMLAIVRKTHNNNDDNIDGVFLGPQKINDIKDIDDELDATDYTIYDRFSPKLDDEDRKTILNIWKEACNKANNIFDLRKNKRDFEINEKKRDEMIEKCDKLLEDLKDKYRKK